MRDPERIDPLLDVIRQVWEVQPDLRLTQMIMNPLIRDDFYIYNTEDERLARILTNFYLTERVCQFSDECGDTNVHWLSGIYSWSCGLHALLYP